MWFCPLEICSYSETELLPELQLLTNLFTSVTQFKEVCFRVQMFFIFQWNSEILKTKRNTRVDSDSRCVPVHSSGSAGGAERHLQQDHLPVLGRVAFVDVPRESR